MSFLSTSLVILKSKTIIYTHLCSVCVHKMHKISPNSRLTVYSVPVCTCMSVFCRHVHVHVHVIQVELDIFCSENFCCNTAGTPSCLKTGSLPRNRNSRRL